MSSNGANAMQSGCNTKKFAQDMDWSEEDLHRSGLSQTLGSLGDAASPNILLFPTRTLEPVNTETEEFQVESVSHVAMSATTNVTDGSRCAPTADRTTATEAYGEEITPTLCVLPTPSCKTRSGADIYVTCPVCKTKFQPVDMVEKDGFHFCPSCNTEMSEETFMRYFAMQEARFQKRYLLRKRWANMGNFVASYKHDDSPKLCRLVDVVGGPVFVRMEATKRTYRKAKDARTELLKSCYYSSDWYLATGLPLDQFLKDGGEIGVRFRRSDTLDGGTSENAPYYFDLEPVGRKGGNSYGVYAEWRVFQAINKARHDKSSPLYGAHLFARTIMPAGKSGKMIGGECDALIVTRYSIYVIEVKTGLNIFSINGIRDTLAQFSNGQISKLPKTFRQCDQHGKILARRIPFVPEGRIKRVLVYADSKYKQSEKGFVDGRYIGACNRGDDEFIRAIEREERKSRDTQTECLTASQFENIYTAITGRTDVRHETALSKWGEQEIADTSATRIGKVRDYLRSETPEHALKVLGRAAGVAVAAVVAVGVVTSAYGCDTTS